jgi:hypothetical protein
MELKKIFAGGTTTLIRNKFKYTTETQYFKYFVGKKGLKNMIWRSSPLDPIEYSNRETINLP